MSATSPLGAAGALGLALLTTFLLQRRLGAPPPPHRFAPLDGLRGYAAFLVFLHHTTMWHDVARAGVWEPPATRLYSHFGQSSVAVFFMITGFLFSSKVIDGRTRPIDWRRLYLSRILRLAPLFVFFVALLWIFALALQGFHLRVSVLRAGLDTLEWLTFAIAGMPDLNRVTTSTIGGAAWSLPYEWWFYLSLPFAAALAARRPPRAWLAVGVAGVAAGSWWISVNGHWEIAAAFLGGVAAAFLVRQPAVRRLAPHPAASIVCIAALAAVTRFPTTYGVIPLLLMSTAFAIIAGGNSLFGALTWPAARGLGDTGYSIYLLHNLVLFVVFGLILAPAQTAALSPNGYWLTVAVCTLLVTVVSFVTFRLIEAPAMRSVDRINALMAP